MRGIAVVAVALVAAGCSAPESRDVPSPGGSPTLGANHELVPDPAGDGVLLLTGPPEGEPAGEPLVLWRWDGEAWSEVAVEGDVPPSRSYFVAAHDADRDVVVLYGGDLPTDDAATVWEWDGTTWSSTPGAEPGPRLAAAAAYDAERGVVVVHGGDDGQGRILNDTWAWDGTSWSRLTGRGPTPPRFVGAVVDDPDGGLVQLGGHQVVSEELPPVLRDTWELTDGGWRRLDDVNGPGDVVNAKGLVHPELGPIVVGGSDFETENGDVLGWDGARWQVLAEDVFPPRQAFGLAYDEGRDVVVLTGGVLEPGSTERRQDVWEWNGDLDTPAELVSGRP